VQLRLLAGLLFCTLGLDCATPGHRQVQPNLQNQPGEYSTHADVNWQVLETSVCQMQLSAGILVVLACTGLCSICAVLAQVQHLDTAVTACWACRLRLREDSNHAQRTGFWTSMWLSERRCSCLHRVCAKLLATWTRPQATTMYRVLNKFASSWRAVALSLQTSCFCRDLMLHAQGWRSTCCSACTGFVQRLYMYAANYTFMVCRTHPSEVMGMWRLSSL
jgi:hypothetical protein